MSYCPDPLARAWRLRQPLMRFPNTPVCFAICMVVFLLSGYFSNAQIVPAQAAKLNYIQIMFQHEAIPGADQYITQVTEDTTGATFNHVLFQKTGSAPATIISAFKFAKKYKWRYAGIKNGREMKWMGPYHFEILDLPRDSTATFDAGFYRARIFNNDSSKNKGGLIAVDLTHSIIGRDGQPVWFLPDPEKWIGQKGYLSDLRLTPYGTVTFLTDSTAFECDLNGNILWQAPNDGKISGDIHEHYNHVFQRLPGGHYMVLSKKFVWKEIPRTPGKPTVQYIFETDKINGKLSAKVEFGTIIEYDKEGHVVWSWDSEKYFTTEDIFYPETSVFDITGNDRGAHMNSFVVDENNEFIYCGFRNYSRIIKIRKATGEVVDSWGLKMPSGEAREGHNFFLKQHDSHILNDGNLAVFNNGDYREPGVPSSVVIFSQPRGDSASRIVWQFDCNFNSTAHNKSLRRGNVEELGNGNLLVCMGQAPRIFEVTRNKQVVWEAVFETIDAKDSIWLQGHLCRAHFTSSLYPCYFTVEAKKQAQPPKPSAVTIKIFNRGSEDDSYNIKISSTSGGFEKQLNTDLIHSGSSGSYQIFTAPSPIGKIEILVKSNTNPDFERKLSIGQH
jgi:hypothetical protein